jgi:hypothetical protein
VQAASATITSHAAVRAGRKPRLVVNAFNSSLASAARLALAIAVELHGLSTHARWTGRPFARFMNAAVRELVLRRRKRNG